MTVSLFLALTEKLRPAGRGKGFVLCFHRNDHVVASAAAVGYTKPSVSQVFDHNSDMIAATHLKDKISHLSV